MRYMYKKVCHFNDTMNWYHNNSIKATPDMKMLFFV